MRREQLLSLCVLAILAAAQVSLAPIGLLAVKRIGGVGWIGAGNCADLNKLNPMGGTCLDLDGPAHKGKCTGCNYSTYYVAQSKQTAVVDGAPGGPPNTDMCTNCNPNDCQSGYNEVNSNDGCTQHKDPE